MDALLFALALEWGLQAMRIVEGSVHLRSPQLQLQNKSDEQKLDKLKRDREIVKGMIRSTLLKMATYGRWNNLDRTVTKLGEESCSAVAKRRHHEELRNSCHEIIRKLAKKRNYWKNELLNADRKVALLRDKLKDEATNVSKRLTYAEQWLCARAESLEMEFNHKRAPMPRAEHENRVHHEIDKIYQLQIEEREKAIQTWQKRYGDDIADMNEMLANKREELQVIVAKRDEMQALYDLHAGEMRAWLSFKEQRAARLAREERQRLAATRIQAWWRGVMVRRAFGPFRYLKNLRKSPSKTKKK